MQSCYCHLQVCKTNESGVEEITCSSKRSNKLKDQHLLGCMLGIFNFFFNLELEKLKKKFHVKSFSSVEMPL